MPVRPTPSRPPSPPAERTTARSIATRALSLAAAEFPTITPRVLDTAALRDDDARLALAIHRTVLQRWLTLGHVLNRFLGKNLQQLEPAMQATLLAGAAQLLFFQRIPPFAVVDETVELARTLVRPGAAGMVNAVLRRVAELVKGVSTARWMPAVDRLPLDDGYVQLTAPTLPDPLDLIDNLNVATSHPKHLVRGWADRYGAATTEICLHGIVTPPTIVAVEDRFAARNQDTEPHETPGFVVWRGPHDRLIHFLNKHPARRVQDPTSAKPAAVTTAFSRDLKLILDFCAGQGTKTRQLAVMHPHAEVIATDTDATRLDTLRKVAPHYPNLRVVNIEELSAHLGDRKADLLLLDVPCSNTGVLGRRPEARYRINKQSLESLVRLQRDIVTHSLPTLAPGGRLLYSTCSIEDRENTQHVKWIADRFKMKLINEELTTPAGRGPTYHDGGYWCLAQI